MLNSIAPHFVLFMISPTFCIRLRLVITLTQLPKQPSITFSYIYIIMEHALQTYLLILLVPWKIYSSPYRTNSVYSAWHMKVQKYLLHTQNRPIFPASSPYHVPLLKHSPATTTVAQITNLIFVHTCFLPWDTIIPLSLSNVNSCFGWLFEIIGVATILYTLFLRFLSDKPRNANAGWIDNLVGSLISTELNNLDLLVRG